VFKRADRRYYSVKFKSEKSGKYLPPISTRQETEAAAIRIAFDWLKNGIPQKDEALSLQKELSREQPHLSR
jgi:hypothetical protein